MTYTSDAARGTFRVARSAMPSGVVYGLGPAGEDTCLPRFAQRSDLAFGVKLANEDIRLRFVHRLFANTHVRRHSERTRRIYFQRGQPSPHKHAPTDAHVAESCHEAPVFKRST